MGWVCGSCSGSNPDGTRFCGHCGSRAAVSPERSVEERRMVTSLFADISGFTTLSEQIDDPEQLHEIIAPVISRLAAIAERYGGTIAKYAGDALLVFFGAPVANEDDAARAVLVALEMHRDLPSILEGLSEQAGGLTLHIGINTGLVISGRFGGDIRSDYSILGDAVILAQRLESVAKSGETLVGQTTYELTKEQFNYEDMDELALKGKSKPTQAYRLVGTQDLATLSGTAAGRSRTPFVGRGEELAAIEGVLGPLVAEGVGGFVSVAGEPGVGKSRLIRVVRERAAVRGVKWYQARCPSYGSSIPYWPIIDLLRQVIGFKVEDPEPFIQGRLQLALIGLSDAFPLISKLLGLPAGAAVDDLEPEAFRRRLHRALADWVAGLAAGGPIIFAVEDLHWIDSASLAFLTDLAEMVAGHPIAFLVTARVESRDACKELAGGFASDRRVDIEMGPLDESTTHLLLGALLEGDPPARLIDFATARTGGNPLFVEELVRALQDSGSLTFDGARWRMAADWDAGAVPDSVDRLLAARIDMLPGSTAGVLQTASVVGRVIRMSLMRAMSSDVPELDGELGRLLDRGFFDRTVDSGEDAIMFHHALVQDVAYGRMLKRNRLELHRRVVDVAERLYGAGDEVIDLLARHAYLGETGAKAVDYLRMAGERSRRLFANDQAIQHFRHAIESAESTASSGLPAGVPGIKLALAQVHDLVGDLDEAGHLYDQVVQTDGSTEAWKGLASIARRKGDPRAALELIDVAFSETAHLTRGAIGGTVRRLRRGPSKMPLAVDTSPLWIERVSALITATRMEEAIEAVDEALRDDVEPNSPAAGHLLLQQAYAESVIDRSAEALAHAESALCIFESNSDLAGVTRSLQVIGGLHAYVGRHTEAVGSLRRGLELAERTGNVEQIMACLVNLSVAEIHIEDFAHALEHGRMALSEAERVGHVVGQTVVLVNIAEALMGLGELDAALAECDRSEALGQQTGQDHLLADVHSIKAQILMRQGRDALAAESAERSGSLWVSVGSPAQAVKSFELAASAAARAGDAERARSLADRARSLVA